MFCKPFAGHLAVLFFSLCIISAHAQTSGQNTLLDTALVRQLGADEYGMQVYTLVFLKAGPNRDQDEKTVAALQSAHLGYLRSLFEMKKLVTLGPLLDESEIKGICIFAAGLDEAKQLAENDPMVISGRLLAEVHPWYGSATLQLVPALHQTVEGKSFGEIK